MKSVFFPFHQFPKKQLLFMTYGMSECFNDRDYRKQLKELRSRYVLYSVSRQREREILS